MEVCRERKIKKTLMREERLISDSLKGSNQGEIARDTLCVCQKQKEINRRKAKNRLQKLQKFHWFEILPLNRE